MPQELILTFHGLGKPPATATDAERAVWVGVDWFATIVDALPAAGVGLALPGDKSMFGYLSEHHSFGESEDIAGEYTEELAAEMLATTLNVEFDPDLSWDEKKEVYRISNKIVRTMNITQSAVGDKRGLWTTVLAAAILLGEDD